MSAADDAAAEPAVRWHKGGIGVRGSGGGRVDDPARGAAHWLAAPLFRPLYDGHPAETAEYRQLFGRAAAFVALYRIVGTAAEASALSAAGPGRVDDARALAVMVGVYSFYNAWLTWQWSDVTYGRLHFGRGNRRLLDSRVGFAADLALAFGLSLASASILAEKTVFLQYSEVFWVGVVSCVALFAGRYGGRLGFALVLSTVPLQLAMAAANGLAASEIEWAIVLTRALWAVAGAAGGVVLVRLITKMVEEHQARLEQKSRADHIAALHEEGLTALQAARLAAHSDDGTPDGVLELVRETLDEGIRQLEGAIESSPISAESAVHEIVQLVVENVSNLHPAMRFEVVPAGEIIVCPDPEALHLLLTNLCSNACRHSMGSMTTVRWVWRDDAVTLTVRDDGIGPPPGGFTQGHGLARVTEMADRIGGSAESSDGAPGTRWEVRFTAAPAQGPPAAEGPPP